MASLLKKLRIQYEKKYDFNSLEKHYREPKIYHGGKDFDLSKMWYVYYSVYHPTIKSKTGKPKLIRQPPIYDNINRKYNTKEDRLKALKELRETISSMLKEGYTPYPLNGIVQNNSIENYLNFAIEEKEGEISTKTLKDYKSKSKVFLKFIERKRIGSFKELNQSDVNEFLKIEAKRTSDRSSNNCRSSLSSLFTTLKQKGYLDVNYFENAKKLKSTPQTNKAYTPDQVKELLNYAYNNHFYLWVYVAHVYYALMRPITIVRLKVVDINMELKTFNSNTKTGMIFKQIPDVLFKEYYSKIELKEKGNYVVTKYGTPSKWIENEKSRADYLTKSFRKHILDRFGYAKEYNVYSFRHSAIGKLFLIKMKEFENEPNSVNKALDSIMDITAHTTRSAVKKYLREIGYFKIKDWSSNL